MMIPDEIFYAEIVVFTKKRLKSYVNILLEKFKRKKTMCFYDPKNEFSVFSFQFVPKVHC